VVSSQSLMPFTHDDLEWMSRAIGLARRGEGAVEPNPMVGCVLVKDGRIVAEGYHRRFGSDHAEVDAMKSIRDAQLLRGATAYVTLEPCCHTGKTPPCTDALLVAGISRVVIAMRDPFPKVDGGGIEQLRIGGIEVALGCLHHEALTLNAPYIKRLHQRRPWVIAKWAMSIDGRIATMTGDSQWITGPVARADVHQVRGRVDAIIIGGRTMVADNPTLTARPPGQRIATRIVLAGKRLPSPQSNLVATADQGPVWVIVSPGHDDRDRAKLVDAGIRILEPVISGRAETAAWLLDELGVLSMTNVVVEGGGETIASFSSIDQIDEIHAYVGAKLIGGTSAPGPVGGAGLMRMVDSPEFRCIDVRRFDNDVRMTFRRQSR